MDFKHLLIIILKHFSQYTMSKILHSCFKAFKRTTCSRVFSCLKCLPSYALPFSTNSTETRQQPRNLARPAVLVLIFPYTRPILKLSKIRLLLQIYTLFLEKKVFTLKTSGCMGLSCFENPADNWTFREKF